MNITQDPNITAYRLARANIDEQFGYIVEALLDYRTQIAAKDARIEHLRTMVKKLQKEVGNLGNKLSGMKYQRDRAEKKAAQSAPLSMGDAFADMILDTRSNARAGLNKRHNRIATGILNRINDGHIPLARELAKTLIAETENGYVFKEPSEDSSKARPDTDSQADAVPYLGQKEFHFDCIPPLDDDEGEGLWEK